MFHINPETLIVQAQPDYIEDENGNRCSLKRFRTLERCRQALATLVRCRDCRDCVTCVDCVDCSDCAGCIGCGGCFRIFGRYRLFGRDESLYGYSIIEPVTIPVLRHIHERVFDAASRPNALRMDDWHTCETAHCRAGWIVHLAGKDGYRLESYFGPSHAARLIYLASDPSFELENGIFDTANSDAMLSMYDAMMHEKWQSLLEPKA